MRIRDARAVPSWSDLRECIVFSATAAAGMAGYASLTHEIKRPGTVEQIRVRFYVGCELNLRVLVKIRHKGQGAGIETSLIKYVNGGNEYVDGDDDEHVFKVAFPVAIEDTIVVYYQNVDAVDAFSLRVFVDVDYLGGESRTLPGVV